MSNVRRFQKKEENFICENCSTKNTGDGFTNHCSECFYSKHVDIFPGDRLESCRGLMEPVEVYKKNENYIIVHKCLKCGEISKDKFREEVDNFDNFLALVKKLNKKKDIRI